MVIYGPDVDNEVKIRWLDTGKRSSYINQDLVCSNTLPDIEVILHTATGCRQQLTVACLPQVTVVTPAGQRHAVRVPRNATVLAMQARVAEVFACSKRMAAKARALAAVNPLQIALRKLGPYTRASSPRLPTPTAHPARRPSRAHDVRV